METLFLSGREVLEFLDMPSVLRAVEQVFADYAMGKASMPPKSYLRVESGDFRAMPASVPGAAGIKWVSVHPNNPAIGKPTVLGMLIYNDPSSGFPLAVMDAPDITAYRTGAAAAIASKYLARKDSHTLGLVGAGRQSHTQLMAHLQVFRLDEVYAYDLHSEAVGALQRAFPEVSIRSATLEAAVACDIVCTTTSSREPVVSRFQLRPGTHINAVGADAKGKEELDPGILNDAVVVVDDFAQAEKSGEINVPISHGLFSLSRVYASLGQVISGQKAFNRHPRDLTVFDSTGLGIQDLAVAKLVYERATAHGKGRDTQAGVTPGLAASR